MWGCYIRLVQAVSGGGKDLNLSWQEDIGMGVVTFGDSTSRDHYGWVFDMVVFVVKKNLDIWQINA